jgi:UDP-glucose 4-epimerase
MKEDEYILIAGGAGYIGSHTNKALSSQGYKTIVFDNLIHGHSEFAKWGEFAPGDLKDPQQIRRVSRKHPIKAVMHFAAYAYVAESMKDPQKYYLNNVANTLNLLKVMKEYEVQTIIFSSSCTTYGIPNELPIPETHAQNAISPYGKSKLMVEEILKDYSIAYGLKYVSLRYFNAAGADPETEIGEWHEPETHLVPLILDIAIGKKDHINIFGIDYDTRDGTCIRDYIHVTDLADAHILALKYLLKGGDSDAFNLGNGDGYSVKEIIDTAGVITGQKIKVVNTARRPGDAAVLVGSAKKAGKILGWKPVYKNIDEIIATAWAWHRKKFIGI